MFIATPAYNGPPRATKLTAEGIHARHGGLWRILPGCPWVGNARSELAGQFLESGESLLFWLDADVAFDPAIVQQMLDVDAPIVTCAYPKRQKPDEFAVRRIHGARPRFVGGHRVIALESDGLGCCLVRRAVIEALYARYPMAAYVNDDGKARCHIFAHGVTTIDGVRRAEGEDGAFFRRALECGFPIECLVDATIYHDGQPGNLGEEIDAENAAKGLELLRFQVQGERHALLNA